MSGELVRFKYKKDIIENIEESWEYYGKEDKLRKVIRELNNVYKIASSAKNAPKSESEVQEESNSDYKAVINALNNYYGNKMNLYVEGSKYREEYRQKMKEQKKLVEELQAKANAFDAVLKSYEESLSEGHMADEVCNIVEKYNKQEELE